LAEITAFGGVSEIGGNKILLRIDKSSVFLDFGTSYKAEGCFFEEFLQPRTGCVLHDLIRLGILPRINGVYRQDAILPLGMEGKMIKGAEFWMLDIRSYEASRDKGQWTPDAVLISHAHDDHFGYLPLMGDMPVVCSKTTGKLLKAISDVGNLNGFDKQLTEMDLRRIGFLGKSAYFPNEPKVDFENKPHPRHFCYVNHKDRVDIGDLKITAFNVDHSVPGAMAYLIESERSSALYTGDIRFHGWLGYKLQEDLCGLQPDVMICEGTRIEESEPDDEKKVQEDLVEVIAETEGLSMISFAWKDIDRYETVKNAAIASGRIPIFDPRLAYLLARLGRNIYAEGAKAFLERTDSLLYSKGDYVKDKHKIGLMSCNEWDNKTKRCSTEHFDNGISAVEIRKNPEQYVIQLDYFRFKNILDFEPPEDSTFVRAQCEPFNTRMQLSEEKLKTWLQHFKINERQGYEPIQIHASGHASGPEIQAMIDAIKPKILIPVHTKYPELFKNDAGKIVVIGKGIPQKL